MVIPKGVNFLEFYRRAKEKGINISSRFMGVSIYVQGLSVSWRTVYISEKIRILDKKFPFTEQGEIEAGECYKNFIEKNGLCMKSKNIKEPIVIARKLLK